MNKKILVVDDEVNICELLKMELEFEGYEVVVCHDGLEALKAFETEEVDLILLDIMLPGMNGFEVCKKITAVSDVPVLMLTAKTDIVDKVLGLEFGADDYITKPFDMRELLARIKVLLRRSNIKNESEQKNMKNIFCKTEISRSMSSAERRW